MVTAVTQFDLLLTVFSFFLLGSRGSYPKPRLTHSTRGGTVGAHLGEDRRGRTDTVPEKGLCGGGAPPSGEVARRWVLWAREDEPAQGLAAGRFLVSSPVPRCRLPVGDLGCRRAAWASKGAVGSPRERRAAARVADWGCGCRLEVVVDLVALNG